MGTKTQQLSNSQLEKLSNQIVDWQTVHTASTLNAVSGRGYFINTTSNVCTITLPGSPVIGDTITIVDYASTFATNNVTINPNGNKIEADTSNGTLSTNDQTHTLVFIDSTQGWKIVNQDTASTIQPSYTAATGGTVTTSGDFKIHSFTGDGCFVVSQIGNSVGGGSGVDYLVVAGGGGASGGAPGDTRGGAGAGGFRYSASTYCSPSCAPGHPLRSPTGLTIAAQTYPVTVGGGGTGQNHPDIGTTGSNSVFSTITSAGGGSTNSSGSGAACAARGGSGGGNPGGGGQNPGGAGNTPPTSPPQGNNGGANSSGPDHAAGGGGGATAVGATGGNTRPGGGANGGAGAGLPNAFGTSGQNCGSYYYFSGGGGGAGSTPSSVTAGSGGIGGGGDGVGPNPSPADPGTTNTGGGGGGGGPGATGGNGGSGIVVVRYKFQN